MKKKLRKVLALTLIATALVSTAACGKTADTTNEEQNEAASEVTSGTENTSEAQENSYEGVKLRVADYTSQFRLEVAYELGFFEEEFAGTGVELELVTMSDGPSFVDAVASDQVDFGLFGDQPIIAGYASGKDVEIIGAWSHDSQTFRLIANEASGIKKPEDIKGKKISVQIGTTNHKMLLKLLEAEGISEDEVEIINLSKTDALTALASGDIDAFVVNGVNGIRAIENGGVLITDFTDYAVDVQIIAANSVFAEEYPELTAKFIKVVNRTMEWINDNPDEAKELVINLREIPQEQADILYSDYERHVGFTEEDKKALNDTATFMYEQGLIDEELTTDDFVDTTYLELAGLLD